MERLCIFGKYPKLLRHNKNVRKGNKIKTVSLLLSYISNSCYSTHSPDFIRPLQVVGPFRVFFVPFAVNKIFITSFRHLRPPKHAQKYVPG